MQSNNAIRLGLGALVFLAVTISSSKLVLAQTSTGAVSISATVVSTTSGPTNPTVSFSGLAAPQATITIKLGATSVATQIATATATFNVALIDQPVGQRSYLISAVDASGAKLAPVTFALDLTAGTNTIITGVFLGPSIAVDKSAVKLGQFLTLSGTTAPSSAVTVAINSTQPVDYRVTAGTDGRWSKLVNSQEIGVGSHTAAAQAVSGGSQVSVSSATVSFAVNPLGQFDGKKTADLDANGQVNLVDFSILLFYWGQRNPANSRADINGDGVVDVVDFSIMLFQWTG